jgi:hypothetical protein
VEPEQSDQVDPWIQQQARPAPAASIPTQPQPNGTAHLPAEVFLSQSHRSGSELRLIGGLRRLRLALCD